MTKKIVKKKKLRIFRLLLIFLILGALFFAIYLYFNMKIQNLMVVGNYYLSDDEILKDAGVIDYPSFYLTFSHSIRKKLLQNPLVKEVEIHRSFYHVLTLKVTEHQVLFFKKENGKAVLDDGSEIGLEREARIPTLMNYVPNTKYKKFINKMTKIKKDIHGKISEIEYQPNEHDKDRFLLYMDDGNSIYLTLTKFSMLNYYNDVLPQLEEKKGILYLDSGNHFKIME